MPPCVHYFSGFLGVSLHLARLFARQILEALAFLGRPEIDVVHAHVTAAISTSFQRIALLSF